MLKSNVSPTRIQGILIFISKLRRKPFLAVYQGLPAYTLTFESSIGFLFSMLKTFLPAMEMLYMYLTPTKLCETSMLVHSPRGGRLLKVFV